MNGAKADKKKAKEAKKESARSTKYREAEAQELREAAAETDKELKQLRADLGSMQLLAGRFERENLILSRKEEKAQGLSVQLAKAEEINEIARQPLEQYAKIRRRLFNQGRSGDVYIQEQGNRAAHDGDIVPDVALCRLGLMKGNDLNLLGRFYGEEFQQKVNSGDFTGGQSRGYALELVNLRASMKLEDPGTCLKSILEEFQELDEQCMAVWEELKEAGLTDEEMCRSFDDRQDVQDCIVSMKELRKRAGGRAGKRTAFE
ncbi:hypothetical protein VTL71DRAFT_8817 [Oculimacula yallundae]|uniref:Uncharacterized protein n=1 Tax=Oculimacula yallundae TaxID=86028 RepID=A0ABR4CYU1_9HELO